MNSRGAKLLVWALALLGGLGFALWRSGTVFAKAPTSILIVTIDTLRADHTSAYGYALPTTPVLEAFAREGVRCATAYAPMPTTLPSHASMFTGRLPRAHGVLRNGDVLDPQYVTLAERCADRGYDTGAIVASFPLTRMFGLEQGFATYDDAFTGEHASIETNAWEGFSVGGAFDRRADQVTTRAIDWLRSRGHLDESGGGQPFLLWVHYFDPHAPYGAPAEHAQHFPPKSARELDRAVAGYDGEIRFVDHELGRLLDALRAAGQLDSTLVAVVGDHGEGLNQHGLYMEHGFQLFEEAVRVPLVFRWPAGLPAGRTIEAPVQVADLAPTLLGLVGIPWFRADAQALDLGPLLRGEQTENPQRPAFLQRRSTETALIDGMSVLGEKYGVRAGRWKFIVAPAEGTEVLFDLATDPGETRDVAAEHVLEVQRMTGILDAWLATPAAQASSQTVSEDALRTLGALGYVR